MMNYYYELKDGVTTFGQDVKYLARFDFHPNRAVSYEFKMHDDAVANSSRVWLENSNGVSLIKGPVDNTSWGRVDKQELVWLKLVCRDIESL
jgi:hypothetical protein